MELRSSLLLPAFFLLAVLLPQCFGGTNSQLNEHCGTNKFYCRSNSTCVQRRFRCPTKNGRHWRRALDLCPQQDHCQPMPIVVHPTTRFGLLLHQRRHGSFRNRHHHRAASSSKSSSDNRFYILTAFSPIYRTGSRSRRGVLDDAWRTLIKDPWMHSFVQYRGFVYEYGTYGVHELDINDPDYKYDREWSTGWSRVGTSLCRYRDLKKFVHEWRDKRSKYSWYSNNCHSFTNALLTYLKGDCKDLGVALG